MPWKRLHSTDWCGVIHEVVERGDRLFSESVWAYSCCLKEAMRAPGVEGLGILKGEILKDSGDRRDLRYRIWAGIPWIFRMTEDCSRGFREHPYVYFVHSYYLKAADDRL